MEGWRGAIFTGKPFEMEFPLRGADGRFRMFLTRVEPMKDSQGRVVQWFGTNTDVDELKRMEESLRETQARPNSTLAAGSIGTWTLGHRQRPFGRRRIHRPHVLNRALRGGKRLAREDYLRAVLDQTNVVSSTPWHGRFSPAAIMTSISGPPKAGGSAGCKRRGGSKATRQATPSIFMGS